MMLVLCHQHHPALDAQMPPASKADCVAKLEHFKSLASSKFLAPVSCAMCNFSGYRTKLLLQSSVQGKAFEPT